MVEGLFSERKSFVSKEAVVEWIKATGRRSGMNLVVSRTDKTVYDSVWIVCDRSGEYKPKSMVKGVIRMFTSTKKMNCPFEIYAAKDRGTNVWVIKKKYLRTTILCTLQTQGHTVQCQRMSLKQLRS